MSDLFRKPPCKLIDEDGNVFAIMGRVRRALQNDGQSERADEFCEKATQGTYDDVLRLLSKYVEVE